MHTDKYSELVEFAKTLPKEYIEKVAADSVNEMLEEEKCAEKRIEQKIIEAEKHTIKNGLVPIVFRAITLDGHYHVGFKFRPVGVEVGDHFHYDHGVGVQKNMDAMVVWVKNH